MFNGEPIPYPKRECIADEDNKEDKNDAGKEQVCISCWVSVICMQLLVVALTEEWTKGAFREEGQTQLR